MSPIPILPAASADIELVTRFIDAVWSDARPDLLDQFIGADFIDHASSGTFISMWLIEAGYCRRNGPR